jgi:short-subunit dehydrogenase
VIAADLADPSACEHVAQAIAEHGLDVEILINNAGFGAFGTVIGLGPDRQAEMVRLNCAALVDLQARFGAEMAKRGRGAILNVASTASFQPLPNNATYAATKAFVLSLSEGSHPELKRKGVTVTALCPGPVRTEFPDVAGVGDRSERLPEPFWLDAASVAKSAVDGLEHGKRVVIPGLMNRAGAMGGQHAPRSLLLPLVNRVGRSVL